MKKNSLISNTPYQNDLGKLAKDICRMAESSSAIEGINVKVSYKNGKFSATSKSPSQK